MTAKTDTAPIRAELEQVAQPSDKRDIVDLIRRNKPELEKLLGPSLTVEQFETAAMTYGGKSFEVLDPEHVAERRKRSASQKLPASPWNTDTEAMWRKSAVRQLQRWLPQTPESAHGLATDETVADLSEDDVQEVGEEDE